MTKIGVLGLQGSFAEHISAIERCGAQAVDIRHSWQMADIDGLIIPGGESTAIAKLTADNPDPIFDTIKLRVSAGLPVYGTCMGSIFLAKEIEGSEQGRLACMNIKVRRNAFGPQRNSFETAINIEALGADPFPAVFIRAPIVVSVGAGVKTLATVEEGIVMARQDNLLVTAFHPEITDDLRVHKYFLDIVASHKKALVGCGAVSVESVSV
ncbi:MAG TPA: pyridoxal 5'-phosphate synthase glutaminase subunit PdxT [Drouetiella sp.]|jgi:pyridoxal 5'-phosphate synthase pdxT subunit